MKKLCFLLLYALLPFASHAQKYTVPFHQLSPNDGLSQGYVKTMFQDSRGFMWFGTRDGLNRYDGYEFKVYKKVLGDSCSLNSNVILSLAEDSGGKLWIGAVGGLYRFDPLTECFEHFQDTLSKKVPRIFSIYIDAKGLLWLGTRHLGLQVFNPATRHFTSFGLPKSEIQQITENASQRYLWLLTDNPAQRVEIFDKEQRKIVTSQYPLKSMGHSPVQAAQSPDGKHYVYQLGKDLSQIIRFNPLTGKTQTFQIPPAPCGVARDQQLAFRRIYHFFVDKQGFFWQFTPQGLLCFDLQKQQLKGCYNFSPTATVENLNLLVDRSGLVWISTAGQGVGVFHPKAGRVQNFSPKKNAPYSLSFKGVRVIHEDTHKRLWVGGYTGLDVFAPNVAEVHHFAGNLQQSDKLLHGLNAEAICEDADGQLWVAAFAEGLFRLDYDHGRLMRVVPKDTVMRLHYIFDIITGVAPHTLWLSTSRGLQKLDTRTHSYTFYKHESGNPRSLPLGFLFALYRDQKGTMWVGSEQGGFARFDTTTQTFTRFTHQPGKANSLSHNNVHAFYEDKAGNFWIATGGGGLNLFDREKLTFKHYTQKDGLPNNVVNGILEDEEGNLWLSTNQGIAKFDPQAETFINFDQRDGLQANEFNRHAYFKNKDGRMFFGGVNGVSAFYPQDLKKNEFVPPIVITKFKKLNQEISLCQVINEEQELELSHKDAIISFEFAALNFYQSDKNQYAYKLEGLHKEWVQLGTHRDITFANLAPGSYTLRVKAANNDGVWNEQGLTLKIRVTPPWWATTWFRLGAVLLILLVIVMGYSWRLQQAKRTRLQLEQLVDERTRELKKLNHTKDRFFGIIAHDLRGPLASFQQVNYLLNHYIKKQDMEKVQTVSEQIDTTAKKLNRLLNNLLDWAMVQQNSVIPQPEELDLHQQVQDCMAVYQGSLDLHQIQIENKVPEGQVLWADPHSVTSLIQNLIGNATKFTPDGGNIEVTAQYRDDELVLAIKDSGVGMDAATLKQMFELSGKKSREGLRGEQGVGLGLTLCQEFARLNNATLTADSQPNEGTTFYVTFREQKTPINQQNASTLLEG
ncbi:sensor histidine kinase [Microscilla marina]|nr:two-component regulator propeller domain-containing protein [Microscilla marina]